MKINKLTLLFGLVFSFAAIPFSALAQDDVEEVVILGVRYLGETDDLNANNIDFDAFTYFDATAIYSVNDNMSVTLGVSNLLDKESGYSLDAGTAPGNGSTFPGYFDAFGRHIHLSINYSY